LFQRLITEQNSHYDRKWVSYTFRCSSITIRKRNRTCVRPLNRQTYNTQRIKTELRQRARVLRTRVVVLKHPHCHMTPPTQRTCRYLHKPYIARN